MMSMQMCVFFLYIRYLGVLLASLTISLTPELAIQVKTQRGNIPVDTKQVID